MNLKNVCITGIAQLLLLTVAPSLRGQDTVSPCAVRVFNIAVSYKGECKNGLANGQGDASGAQHYKGNFKNGKPDGYGVYYYDDSTWYSGYFLDGLKEGRGEAHYAHKGLADSTVKGYWSGNEFRGAKYITYDFDGGSRFDRYEINGTAETGHTIRFEVYTTSGSPDGFPSDLHGLPGYVLKLTELNAGDNTIIRVLSEVNTPTRFFATYDIGSFPAILYGKMSNGDSFKLHLYKSAKWTARFFVNK